MTTKSMLKWGPIIVEQCATFYNARLNPLLVVKSNGILHTILSMIKLEVGKHRSSRLTLLHFRLSWSSLSDGVLQSLCSYFDYVI